MWGGSGNQVQQQATKTMNANSNDLLVRIPPMYQMSRNLALETLIRLIPNEVLEYATLSTLDIACTASRSFEGTWLTRVDADFRHVARRS
mmetsp:Transcript_2747/g.6281  ORF Transcript_2747/g.6281 Transcript_2747/m.6281 type:complete len:90 (-) Transcript_2747:646-915(-)